MKRLSKWVLAGAVLLGTMAPNVFAGSGCSDCDCGSDGPVCLSTLERLFGNCGSHCDFECGEGCGADCDADNGINIGGWIQMGYHTDGTGLGNSFFGAGSFNQRPHEVQLHQGYLYAEKVADGSNGFDWGFRTDVIYGTDGQDTQAFGNSTNRWDNSAGFDHGNDYGWALPQAYLEIAKGNLSVKAGHFYTIAGYETVTAPDNFFYSHSYTMYNSEPFTHTGALATYTASDNLELYGGWTAGWDTGFEQFNLKDIGIGGFDSGSNFLGGAKLKLNEKLTLTYIGMIGHFGARNTFSQIIPRIIDTDRTSYAHSIVLDTQLTDKLTWVLQSDLVDNGAIVDTKTLPGFFPPFTGNNRDIGLNNYLLYAVSNKVGVGARAEWWHTSGVSFNEVTFGLNYKPTDNIVIRPELRHDWCPAIDYEATGFGVDAIWSF